MIAFKFRARTLVAYAGMMTVGTICVSVKSTTTKDDLGFSSDVLTLISNRVLEIWCA